MKTRMQVAVEALNGIAERLRTGTTEERVVSYCLRDVLAAVSSGRVDELATTLVRFRAEYSELQLAQMGLTGEALAPEPVVESKAVPQGESFWWGRTRGCHYWNLVVEVRGETPFLRLNIWDIKENTFERDASPSVVHEFGSKIVDAPPYVVGKRADWS